MSAPRDPELVVASFQKNFSERVHIILSRWKDRRWLHVRTVAPGLVPNSVILVSQVCVDVERLPELIAALQAAEAEAIRLGLITEAAT